MAARNSNKGATVQIVRAVGTPLGFYVLSLLIIESILGLVLIKAPSGSDYVRAFAAISMIVMFFSVFGTVTYFTAKNPKNLVFGKEEHAAPQLDDSALRDQIEDIVVKSVRPECLKNP